MKGDFMPSIVCGLVHKVGHEKRFEKLIDKKYGMKLRKISFYDLSMPLDNKNYNKAVNYLKHFLCPLLNRAISVIPFKKFVEKRLSKYGLQLMKLPAVRTDTKHPLNLCGFSPLLLDAHYLNSEHYTKEEKANCIKLKTFESKGYKPKVNNKYYDENLIIPDGDLK